MIPQLEFGRTGHRSTRLIFGAAALGGMSEARADATLAQVRGSGINHIDTARSYGDSELRLRSFLQSHRAEFFLATKTGERTAAGARRELEESLERMGVGSVDLVQMHNLVELDEWRTAHEPGGALAGLVQARAEGLVRFIGVTGHGTRIPRMHLRSLAEFDYDSVLFPYNFTMLRDADYRRAVEELLRVCAERQVAVQTIKSAARGRWQPGDDRPRFAWYEPMPVGEELARAVRYVLARPTLFLNTSSDARLLDALVQAASGDLVAPGDDEMERDVHHLGMTRLFDGGGLERI